VILVDANLLIYAHVREMPDHGVAHAWLDRQLNEQAQVGLPWAALLAFVRLVSNLKIFENAVSIPTAWRQIEAWLSAPAAWIPLPTERHREILGSLLDGHPHPRPNLVPDAHLAALAIEHGLSLCTADKGFARFPGLRWENPIAG